MKITEIIKFLLLSVLIISAVNAGHPENLFSQTDQQREIGRIKPWTENESYWQFKGKPVMLIGGTDQDNLFNHPEIGPAGLEAHLDLLVSAGGNYVRNTMSSRDRTDTTSIYFNNDNLYPFYRDPESGLYDLGRFNSEYWERFRRFLDMTAERDIIVQIEIWDRWDYSGDRQPHYMAYGWSAQPYRNNPWHWKYRGEPVMLVGASDRDNLWQWTGDVLTDHLDRMKAAGGNYVRNTMSDSNDGDTYAAKRLPDGKYDINQWNEEYWNKLKFFLEETYKLDIIVQLTLWDWFDLSGDDVYGRFRLHPLNPENNINWEPGTINNAWDNYDGTDWWGPQRIITLATNNHRSYVAVIRVLD